MKTTATRTWMLLLGLVCSSSMVGCVTKSTPPGPDTVLATVEDASFSFLKWKDGLAIMFVDEFNGHRVGGPGGSTEDPVYRVTGSSESGDGHGYNWELETSDGKIAKLKIDGVQYDLGKGGLFVVQLDGDQVIVHQKDVDLSELNTDHEDCQAFLKARPDLLKLASGTSDEE